MRFASASANRTDSTVASNTRCIRIAHERLGPVVACILHCPGVLASSATSATASMLSAMASLSTSLPQHHGAHARRNGSGARTLDGRDPDHPRCRRHACRAESMCKKFRLYFVCKHCASKRLQVFSSMSVGRLLQSISNCGVTTRCFDAMTVEASDRLGRRFRIHTCKH